MGHLDFVANTEDVCHVVDHLVTDLGDVQQAAQATTHVQEGSVQLHRLHGTLHHIPDL